MIYELIFYVEQFLPGWLDVVLGIPAFGILAIVCVLGALGGFAYPVSVLLAEDPLQDAEVKGLEDVRNKLLGGVVTCFFANEALFMMMRRTKHEGELVYTLPELMSTDLTVGINVFAWILVILGCWIHYRPGKTERRLKYGFSEFEHDDNEYDKAINELIEANPALALLSKNKNIRQRAKYLESKK